jgi:hypothetical protein
MCTSKGIKIAKNKSKEEIIAAIQEADDDVASVKSDADEDDKASTAASDNTLEEEEEEKDMISVYKSMKTQDLADICKSKGLSSKGTREILIRRLLTALAE